MNKKADDNESLDYARLTCQCAGKPSCEGMISIHTLLIGQGFMIDNKVRQPSQWKSFPMEFHPEDSSDDR